MIYLKSYNIKQMAGYHTDGSTVYELHVHERKLFGLMKRDKIIEYTVEGDQNVAVFHAHWDDLIETQDPVINNSTSPTMWVLAILWAIIIFPVLWVLKNLYKLLTE